MTFGFVKCALASVSLTLFMAPAYANTQSELKDFVGRWKLGTSEQPHCRTKTVEIVSKKGGKALRLRTSSGIELKVEPGTSQMTREPKFSKLAVAATQYFGGVIASTHSTPHVKKGKEFMSASLRTFQIEKGELVSRTFGYGLIRDMAEAGVHRVLDVNSEVAVARQPEETGTTCRYELVN